MSSHAAAERLWELFDWPFPPPNRELEAQIRAKIAELEADARSRGEWLLHGVSVGVMGQRHLLLSLRREHSLATRRSRSHAPALAWLPVYLAVVALFAFLEHL